MGGAVAVLLIDCFLGIGIIVLYHCAVNGVGMWKSAGYFIVYTYTYWIGFSRVDSLWYWNGSITPFDICKSVRPEMNEDAITAILHGPLCCIGLCGRDYRLRGSPHCIG